MKRKTKREKGERVGVKDKNKEISGREKREAVKEMGRERNNLQPTGEIKYSVLRKLILYYIFIHIDKNSYGN